MIDISDGFIQDCRHLARLSNLEFAINIKNLPISDIDLLSYEERLNAALIGGDDYENYKLEYVADIDYNSLILYPSHYWHNAYLKEDWFIDEDRVTFTGFFELIK